MVKAGELEVSTQPVAPGVLLLSVNFVDVISFTTPPIFITQNYIRRLRTSRQEWVCVQNSLSFHILFLLKTFWVFTLTMRPNVVFIYLLRYLPNLLMFFLVEIDTGDLSAVCHAIVPAVCHAPSFPAKPSAVANRPAVRMDNVHLKSDERIRCATLSNQAQIAEGRWGWGDESALGWGDESALQLFLERRGSRRVVLGLQ